MDVRLELNGKTFKVALPERLAAGQAFAVQMPELTLQALVLASAGVLVVRDATGLERHVHIRRGAATRFAGDAETQVRAELRIGGALYSLRATVRSDLPGQDQQAQAAAARERVLRSQITGKVLKLLVAAGETITAGQSLLIIEAMKMENRVFSQVAGTITSIAVNEGDAVQTGKELLRIAP